MSGKGKAFRWACCCGRLYCWTVGKPGWQVCHACKEALSYCGHVEEAEAAWQKRRQARRIEAEAVLVQDLPLFDAARIRRAGDTSGQAAGLGNVGAMA